MNKRTYVWVLFSIMMLAAGLRLFRLGNESFWADELGQIIVAQNDVWDTILKSANHRGSTPLDYIITHGMLYIGKGEAILRLPAVIFGVGSVLLIALLGTRLFNSNVGLTAAIILAMAPIHIYFSQELRFYSLATFTILATVFSFILAIERNTYRYWVLYVVALTISLYAHYYTGLVLLGLGTWILIFQRKHIKWFALSSGLAVFLFFPWIWWDVIRFGTPNSNPVEFVMPPIIETVGALFLRGSQYDSCQARCQLGAILFLISGPIILLVGFWRAEKKEKLLLPMVILSLGYIGLLGMNIYGEYFFSIRQTLMFLPFLILVGVGSLDIATQKFAPLVLTIILILSILVFLPKIRMIYEFQTKADFRGVASYLLEQMNEDAAIMTNIPKYLLFYEPLLEPYIYSVDRKTALGKFDELHSEGKIVYFVPYRSGAQVFTDIFQTYQRQRHPSFRPLVYAIPKPKEW
jgi:uncharacterized membrane protein